MHRSFVERLEPRRLLSSTLQLQGTSAADTISVAMIGAEVRYAINGAVTYVADIDVTDIAIHGLEGADQLFVESNGDNPVTIFGEAGSDSIFIASNAGNLEAIDAPVFVDGGANGGTLTLYDDHVNQSDTYTITSTSVHRAEVGMISFASLTSLLLQSQGGDNVFNVESTPTFSVTISGRNGNDTMNVSPASQNLNAVAGLLNFQGGAGTDSLYLFDANNPSSDSFVVNAAGVSRASMGTAGFDSENVYLNQGSGNNVTEISSFTQSNLVIDAGLGNDTITLNGIGPTTTVSANGNQGNDIFNVETTAAGSQLHLFGNDGTDQALVASISRDLYGIAGKVDFDGGSGSDVIRFDDRVPTVVQLNYAFTSSSLTPYFSEAMNFSNTELAELFTGEYQDLIFVTNADASVDQRVYSNGGMDEINVGQTVATVTIDSGEGLDHLVVGNYTDPTRARIATDDELSHLTITTNGQLDIPPDVTLATGLVTLKGGSINFARHAALIQRLTMSLNDARVLVNAGYANGAWNGTSQAFASSYSANSSASDGIGYARAADIGVNHYGPFSLGSNDILFTQTLLGDANLDHAVNFNDLLRLAQNYNASNKFWSSGDFNYDQNVNFNDLLRLAQNYGATGITADDCQRHRRIFCVIRSNL